MTAPLLVVPARELASSPDAFFEALRARLSGGERALTFYAQPARDPADATLTAVLAGAAGLSVLRTTLSRDPGFRSLTPDFPSLHVFEREIFEQLGVKPLGHPWLKPVRFAGASGR